MTLQQLRYVVALDIHRHFVKAAESCFVAQPTLTLQVKKLEKEITLTLFDRSSQPLEPTPMGAIFIAKARQILQEVDDLKQIVNEDRDDMIGTFRLGIIPTLAPNLLPLFIKDFIQKHPETKLEIEELQSEKIMEQLLNKQLDIGILATPLEEPHIREIPLFYEPFLIFTDSENELLKRTHISMHQLKPEGLWILRKGHCFRNQTLNICQFDISEQHRNVYMEGGSIETLKKMVKEISGYTLIPELSFDERHDASHTIHFKAPKPVREISIVTHRHFTKEKLIEELRKSILAHTPEKFKKNTRFVKIKWR